MLIFIEIAYLKKNNHRLIVSVTFRLAKSFTAQLSYPALCDAIDKFSYHAQTLMMFSPLLCIYVTVNYLILMKYPTLKFLRTLSR